MARRKQLALLSTKLLISSRKRQVRNLSKYSMQQSKTLAQQSKFVHAVLVEQTIRFLAKFAQNVSKHLHTDGSSMLLAARRVSQWTRSSQKKSCKHSTTKVQQSRSVMILAKWQNQTKLSHTSLGKSKLTQKPPTREVFVLYTRVWYGCFKQHLKL